MNRIEIIPVEYGKSVFGEDMIFLGGDSEKKLPIVFMVYLLKVDSRLILVDAGCETMSGFDMQDFSGPIKALGAIGVSPEDITDVIVTHSHHDHIECVKYYTNADIYIQRDEYELGKGYFLKKNRVRLFDDTVQIVPGVTVVKIAGHSCGSCIVELDDGGKKCIIAGDELYSRRSVTDGVPPGAPLHPENTKKFMEKYCTGDYTVLLCHDK